MREETISLLANSPLFCQLSIEALSNIAAKGRIRQYQPGDMIVWQGEPSATVFLITSGIAAVTRLVAGNGQARTLAYLMPGESFGEVGILENRPRSASVVALTNLEVLTFQRHDFLAILNRHSAVAIEMARILGHYLVEADRRQAQQSTSSRLILLFDLGVGVGTTAFGHALATLLMRKLEQPTVYTEYPEPSRLAVPPEVNSDTRAYHHPAGYDIVIPHEERSLPAVVRATLLLDQISGQYRNAIIALPGILDPSSMVLLEQATHLVLLLPPTPQGLEQLRRLRADLTPYTASGRTGLSVIVSRDQAEPQEQDVFDAADYEVPSLESFASALQADPATVLPEGLVRVVETLVKRIDRSHQVAIYIPTTIAVDQMVDTTSYVERTLAFLGRRFGGATSKQAQGVWRSDQAGLVSETVYIVQTYAAEADLHTYLDEVLAYVKEIKHELQQEAMALEVDQKLMLI